ASDVRAYVDPVAALRVEPTGPTEHHAVAAVRPAERMRCRIRPRSIRRPAVGLDLDDRGADYPGCQLGAEQPPRRGKRVDHQQLGSHRTDCACPIDTRDSREQYSTHDDFIKW